MTCHRTGYKTQHVDYTHASNPQIHSVERTNGREIEIRKKEPRENEKETRGKQIPRTNCTNSKGRPKWGRRYPESEPRWIRNEVVPLWRVIAHGRAPSNEMRHANEKHGITKSTKNRLATHLDKQGMVRQKKQRK